MEISLDPLLNLRDARFRDNGERDSLFCISLRSSLEELFPNAELFFREPVMKQLPVECLTFLFWQSFGSFFLNLIGTSSEHLSVGDFVMSQLVCLEVLVVNSDFREK